MPIPLAIPLILGGAGAISNMVGAGAQAQAARQITGLMKELPTPKMSAYAQQLAGESRL
jgi:hypothetical protein